MNEDDYKIPISNGWRWRNDGDDQVRGIARRQIRDSIACLRRARLREVEIARFEVGSPDLMDMPVVAA